MNEKSILEMADGRFLEIANEEIGKIVANILDPRTKAKAKRRLVITMDLLPDDDRQFVLVKFGTKSVLVPADPAGTCLCVTSDDNGEVCVVEMGHSHQMPGQVNLDGTEQDQPVKLKLVEG